MPEDKAAPVRDSVTARNHKQDLKEGTIHSEDKNQKREKMIDKTLADSYPASDPPSTIPDPSEGDGEAA